MGLPLIAFTGDSVPDSGSCCVAPSDPDCGSPPPCSCHSNPNPNPNPNTNPDQAREGVGAVQRELAATRKLLHHQLWALSEMCDSS